MRGSDAFRRKLRHRLLGIAQARRCACVHQPSGSDLKAIAHCEWLAASAETLEPRLCEAVADTLADPAAARRFAAIWAELPEALGTTVWPRDAGELTVTMVRQSSPEATPSRRARIAATPRAGTRPPSRPQASPPLLTAVAGDFTGGLAVVGPMLAVWQVAVGLRQWNKAAFAAHHPATLARVEAVSSSASGRGASATDRATVSFTANPGGSLCHATVDLGPSAVVGSSVAVVPRSAGCETPLVVATIGDPTASFAMAAAFAMAGLASLKAWTWLSRAPRREPAPSARHLGPIRS